MNGTGILILGSSGQLAREFVRQLTARQRPFEAPPEQECDVTNPENLQAVVDRFSPGVILNCAAYNAVDAAEDNRETAFRINHTAVEHLAHICRTRGCLLVHFSTDYVFDGTKGGLYTEEDAPNPLGVYGASKLAGERAALEETDRSLVFRLSWVFGEGPQNFIHKLRQWAETSSVLKISADEVSVPTSTADVARVTLEAVERGLTGLYHLTNSGYASRYELARHVVNVLNLPNIVIPVPMSTFPTKAQRPRFSAMSNRKICATLGVEIRNWREAVHDFLTGSGSLRSPKR